MRDLETILSATLSGMSVADFQAEAKKWLETARHPRWDRPYTELVYQPMLEVLRYLRDNAYKTYIVTGGAQDFVRIYAEKVYGIPPAASAKRRSPRRGSQPRLLPGARSCLDGRRRERGRSSTWHASQI